jgi:hypothetical protein
VPTATWARRTDIERLFRQVVIGRRRDGEEFAGAHEVGRVVAARDLPGMSAIEIGRRTVEGLAWVETDRAAKYGPNGWIDDGTLSNSGMQLPDTRLGPYEVDPRNWTGS